MCSPAQAGLLVLGMPLSEHDAQLLFLAADEDGSGGIDKDEAVEKFFGPLRDLDAAPAAPPPAAAPGFDARTTALRRLDLSHNVFRAAGCRHLAEMLGAPRVRVRELSLAHNSIGGRGGAALMEGVAANKSLQVLDLTGNIMGGLGDRHGRGALREGRWVGVPVRACVCGWICGWRGHGRVGAGRGDCFGARLGGCLACTHVQAQRER